MAITYFTGFEFGNLSDLYSSGGTVSIQNTVVRTGEYAARIQATGFSTSYVSLAPVVNGQFSGGGFSGAVHYRFYFRYATGPSGFGDVIVSAGGGNPLHNLRLNTDGTLSMYSNTTLLATGTAVLSPNTWYRIDVSGTADGVSPWNVSVDGVSDITTGNVFTQMVELRFGRGSAWGNQTNTLDFYYDDLVLGTSALPSAATRVMNYAPTSNGASQQWTAGTGTTFAEVDDYTDNDTSYWAATGNGEFHYSKMTPTIQAGGNIHAVLAMARVRGTVGGNIASISIRNNGTEASLLQSFPTSYTDYHFLRETDPDGNSAWTLADMGTVETGVKTNAMNGGGQVRATSLMTKVLFDGTATSGGGGPSAAILGGFAGFFVP
jgi:hypothetical protein